MVDERTEKEREAAEQIGEFCRHLEGLRPQKRKELIAALFKQMPDVFVMGLQREMRLSGVETRVAAYVKSLRRQVANPSRSKQQRADAAWELKDMGYDDETLRKDEPAPSTDDD